MKKICIFGHGYQGLAAAVLFAKHGYCVTGIGMNNEIIDMLSDHSLYLQELGLKESFDHALHGGALNFNFQVEPADIFIISVLTPLVSDYHSHDGGPSHRKVDLAGVIAAAEVIFPLLKKGNLVVLESIVLPRTTVDMLGPILERSGLKAGSDFSLVYSRGHATTGQIMQGLVENARIIGGIDSLSADAGCDLYSCFVSGALYVTNPTTAELVCLMENAYVDVAIAFANEFSHLSNRFGVNVWEAVTLANHHPQVNILNPGLGASHPGNSVDSCVLVESAPDLTRVIQAASQVNEYQSEFIIDLVTFAIGSLNGKKIAALGLACSQGVNDLRENLTVEIIHRLQFAGAEVKAYDPYRVPEGMPGMIATSTMEAAVREADVIILLVAHPEFHRMTPKKLAKLTRASILIDTVNGWSNPEWLNSDFKLYRLGDSSEERVLIANS